MPSTTLSLAPAIRFNTAWTGRSVWRVLRTAWRVMAERQELARLSDAALADIGVTEAQAAREATRPIWDLPAGR